MVITDEEWQGVLAHFDEAAPNAAAERDQMATAIADIEVITGKKANTSNDRPGAAIFPTYSTRGQLDCIDESHNTTVYLHFLAKEGVFRYHDVGEVAHRGMIIDRWFHNTATVVDRETGERYVIDTWFGANGDRADIIDVETWIGGWSPENFKTRKDR